ncbi:ribosome biogenesis GTP-binding protein YsxC/EngB [secondary endosymbiont of Heteropsylla cubana]|uniref:Probable GTP-binding protein EngB n=1 Tax=secondary endosymbiont of Heteropsylla cubana TaxID=134287 RepID=J3YSS8_9ENTR|nr:ribosome biogenesis GTP-binding protein YihA/YsxC [secondary endosymbiont of Heteropsylla cubana]AFP85358.1 ribosome biogenesis GTP-binding protein YsxC/EngB [secondary endosymbiont of Heteropsylla cubana]
MKNLYNYNLTCFLTSAPNVNYLPGDSSIEIAFVGYSNSGKSTLINTLTNQKKLARTSKIPGCTQFINLFEVTSGIRLVDLPGYGYAAVPRVLKHCLKQTIKEYLQTRSNLKGLVVLMDIRHPFKKLDQQIVQWAVNMNMPMLLLLNKADKLSLRKQEEQLSQTRIMLGTLIGNFQVEVFSSLQKKGMDKLQQTLEKWISDNKES